MRGFVLVGLVVELWRLVLEDRREERDVCLSVWTGTGEHTVGRWGLRLCGCGWVILCVCELAFRVERRGDWVLEWFCFLKGRWREGGDMVDLGLRRGVRMRVLGRDGTRSDGISACDVDLDRRHCNGEAVRRGG